jgi:hypothetical protein
MNNLSTWAARYIEGDDGVGRKIIDYAIKYFSSRGVFPANAAQERRE